MINVEAIMAAGTTNVGFEEKLWLAADKLRSNMDAAEYKHVVLGLIFLKYVSDSFTEKYNELVAEGYGDEEDRDEYLAESIFWVPKEARWNEIQKHATSTDIGSVIDKAMEAIEKENDSLKGVLTKNFSRPELDKTRLGELVTLFTNIEVGSTAAQERDTLGRVYEYFLGKFASAEGKLGGEFYTPSCIVRTLVEMIEPFEGQIFDPACGSGGMFCQSARFVREHQGNIRDISIFGQESNPTTWKLAKMNLAIRQLEANLGKHNADSFHDDQHKTLKANYILANPPFNISDWGGERLQEDIRWKYGVPPVGNANFAWLQHMLHHLNPVGGVAGTVLANGSLSSNTSNEGVIRKNMINDDVIECIVALPGQLFYSTGIPVSLWIMRKGKTDAAEGKVLFIDARKMGKMIDRRVRELTEEDISTIASTYQNWRQGKEYEDRQGFCKVATLDEIAGQDYVLTPGRYVGIEEQEDDGEPFDEKMKRLTSELSVMFKESIELQEEIRRKLGAIGYEI
ncbi:MAG: type I restriction-modification system subunit M [Lachnoclostridium sp.]|nr:type I restriction-modification system subunit M [Lachnospira sp.]MCM1248806.1 type I restriction-modification system subunit M [Lachnoclostridium sp.]